MKTKLWFILVLVIVLVGCSEQKIYNTTSLPRLFDSPISQSVVQGDPQTYLPIIIKKQMKLGMAGCGGFCAKFGCSWCYAWSPYPAIEPGFESVPMIRDAAQMATVELGGNSSWLMLFNEPDLCPSQACLTPVAAAVLQRQAEERWPVRLFVAPVPSHLNIYWLVDFRNEFFRLYGTWPRMDALAMHCYFRTAAECIALAKQFEVWGAEWGVSEGWLTEFTFTTMIVDWKDQISILATYMEQSNFWTRYAPYVSYEECDPEHTEFWNCVKSGDPSLFTSTGELTEIGSSYLRSFK